MLTSIAFNIQRNITGRRISLTKIAELLYNFQRVEFPHEDLNPSKLPLGQKKIAEVDHNDFHKATYTLVSIQLSF